MKEKNDESIPYLTDISLALMPEGGTLIDGCRQRLAFKAIGNDGYGIDVSVRLVNATGDIIAEGESEHLPFPKHLRTGQWPAQQFLYL